MLCALVEACAACKVNKGYGDAGGYMQPFLRSVLQKPKLTWGSETLVGVSWKDLGKCTNTNWTWATSWKYIWMEKICVIWYKTPNDRRHGVMILTSLIWQLCIWRHWTIDCSETGAGLWYDMMNQWWTPKGFLAKEWRSQTAVLLSRPTEIWAVFGFARFEIAAQFKGS